VNKVVHSTLLTIVLAVAAYGIAAIASGGDEVMTAITSLNIEIWLVILLLSLMNYLLRYWRWHLYIAHQNPHAITHRKHLAFYIAGFSLTMTPGKAGEAMRSLYLKPYGIPHQRSIGALFVERIMDLLTILILAGLGITFLDGEQSRMATVITVALIAGCIAVIKLPKKWVVNSPLVKKLPAKIYQLILFVESMLENANDLTTIRFLLIGLGIGIISWLCEAYGLYIVMEEFSPGQTSATLGIAIYGMAILIGAISFMPGGLGGSEAAMIFLLVKAGFDTPSAVAITFICRIATLWFAVVLGVITMFCISIMGLKPQEEL